MNESNADRDDSRLSFGSEPDVRVPPWMVVNERIPWPGFTQEVWDRLILLRDHVRAGRDTEGDPGTG